MEQYAKGKSRKSTTSHKQDLMWATFTRHVHQTLPSWVGLPTHRKEIFHLFMTAVPNFGKYGSPLHRLFTAKKSIFRQNGKQL